MTQTKIARKRGSQFHVVAAGENLPLCFTNLVTTDGVTREVIRITGGCKNISQEIVDGLPAYFLSAFKGFTGTAFSGGTANFNDDHSLKGFMVTNVPGLLAEHENCIAISTTPRTDFMSLHPTLGAVVMDDHDTRQDHRQHGNVVVQQNASDALDWDGDLDTYFTLMTGWKDAGFKVAIIALNGGGVTKKEIYGALSRGIPVIAVEGSLRETDEFIKAFRAGTAKVTDSASGEEKAVDASLVSIVSIGDAAALRKALIERGIVHEAATSTPAEADEAAAPQSK